MSATRVSAAWGALLLVLGAGLAIWSGGVGPALLLVAGALPLFAVPLLDRRPMPPSGKRVLPRISVPVVLLAFGLSAAAVGLTAGLWLVLVGGEIALIALVGLALERRAERGRQ
jgi:hypothetical protein